MKRSLLLLYALGAYLAGLGTLTYMLLWLYPWSFMPTTVDHAYPDGGALAPAIDLGLIALFGLQHSWMVRPRFKSWIATYLSEASLRATYTLISSLLLALLLYFWHPLPQKIWDFSSPGRELITGLYVAGWLVAVLATFQIDHFELFGLHQAYRAFRGIPEPQATFQERGFYRWVRHPIQSGTLLGIWATPLMSLGHLLFAVAFSVYILIGLYFEERDLSRSLGKEYEEYRRRVPMLLPLPRKK